MTLGDLFALVTAFATVGTVLFLGWDRLDKIRAPHPALTFSVQPDNIGQWTVSIVVINNADVDICRHNGLTACATK